MRSILDTRPRLSSVHIPVLNHTPDAQGIPQIRFSKQPLRNKGFDFVAGRFADTIFGGNGQLLGYHMVNEVDNVKKFENVANFPSVRLLINNWMKDQRVIDDALSNPSIRSEYQEKRILFESMVCVYDHADMAKMRDVIVKKIWCLLNPPSQMQPIWEAALRSPVTE